MEHCKFCHSKNLRKNGFEKGKQRFICTSCRRNQTIEGQNSKYHRLETKLLALNLFKEGFCFRKIGRILNVSYMSVINWVRNQAEVIKNEVAEKIKSAPIEELDVVEIDEMWHFVGKKTKNLDLVCFASSHKTPPRLRSGFSWSQNVQKTPR